MLYFISQNALNLPILATAGSLHEESSALSLSLKLVLVLFLVGLNGFFVAAEFALVKIRLTQLDTMVRKGSRLAKVARRVTGNLDAFLSATQLGITLASLGLGWIGEDAFAALLTPLLKLVGIQSVELQSSIAFFSGFAAITFLHIVVGELAPKSLAIQKPVATSLWISIPLELFYKLSFPLIWILNQSALKLLQIIGIQPANESELAHSEEELRMLIAESKSHGTASIGQENLVLNAFKLKDRVVRDVMRPRQDIVSLDTRADIDACMETVEKKPFSRFPLCESGDLDKTLGVVHLKSLVRERHFAKRGGDLKKTAKKLIYVPETGSLEKVLSTFLERRLHFAIVVDEYGGTVGMITLENILEELVGPIQDEFDLEEPLIEEKGTDNWIIDGSLPIHELSELIGEEVGEEGITTTNGLMTHLLGEFPKLNDSVKIAGYQLSAIEMESDNKTISKLKLQKFP
ncbi:MAG TPA: HlyC/CorC family transporter [Verrucomicrobiales bacterium]|nr:HlyC/CorC family transporter [Verrucomicrobiales bacterium]HIL71539.1 HlyC/CorC family transporter [Verrucomicrobiota bacterium]